MARSTENPKQIVEFFDIAIGALEIQGQHSPQTTKQIIDIIRDFLRFCSSNGYEMIADLTPEFVEAFIHLPVADSSGRRKPSEPTQRNRRGALRSGYRAMRQLGYLVFDPLVDIQTLNREYQTQPICTTQHVEALRENSLQEIIDSPRALIIALAEAGASNGEITILTWDHVQFEHSVVCLPGHLRIDPRHNRLTDWGSELLNKKRRNKSPNDLVVTNFIGQPISAASVSQSFKQVTEFSGLGRYGYTLNSVRAWRGREIFQERGRIEEVSRFIGSRSLDNTARFLGWDWRGAA